MSAYLRVTAIAILGHALVCGPVVWLGWKLGWSDDHGAGRIALLALYPHLLLSRHVPAYDDYLHWWRPR